MAAAALLDLVPLRRRAGVLPGFRVAMGFTLLYLSLIVVLPLGALVLKASSLTWTQFVEAVTGERALAAYRLSFGGSFLAATINAAVGVLIAWVLARYEFPGKSLLDALVDLPFALPTAVAGIALSAIYGPDGWIGRLFAEDSWFARNVHEGGWAIAYARPGVVLALIFVGLPFVVRTVQPVLQDADPAAEEAAATLGASRLRTVITVILPRIVPALLTGFSLAFARALGEYGSVVFVSGNMPLRTEIVPLLIVTKLEQYDYAGATAIATVMLAASFAVLLFTNGVQAALRRGRSR